jgi:hypothetical protein
MKPLQTYFPFGPPIGHAELPKELINDFNKGCDDIVNDKELSKSVDWSHNLVGQVEQELLIPKDIINKWGKWFGSQARAYVSGYFNQLYIPEQNMIEADRNTASIAISKMQIDVIAAWYIRSFAGDYNPVHTHSNCHLTCVGYLKVPDLSKERKKKGSKQKYSPGGTLEILSSVGVTNSVFENDRYAFTPKVGNWYLFPANIRHSVYPFSCDGERRSFSINMNTNIFKSETDK